MEVNQVEGVFFHADGWTTKRTELWSNRQTDLAKVTLIFRKFCEPA